MRDLEWGERSDLEDMIDACGLDAVVQCLADIAHAKGHHIQASYATSRELDPDARRWFALGDKLSNTANRMCEVHHGPA